MFNNIIEEINQTLSKINKKKIIGLGRAGNMMWLHFADYIDNKKSIYALHVSGTFRFCNNKQMILGSQDMYTESSSIEWNENFQWDIQGANLFDELSEKWLKKVLEDEVYVSSFQANHYGDLTILLSNNDKIQIFVNNSSEEEVWRFFKIGDKEPHFVITGQGIES
ncbi:MAG: hypothetical protein E7399_07835 [Ruminococcaceae bacterium]|nr:hypothetical protein [Oscillospiraceae bacterium]